MFAGFEEEHRLERSENLGISRSLVREKEVERLKFGDKVANCGLDILLISGCIEWSRSEKVAQYTIGQVNLSKAAYRGRMPTSCRSLGKAGVSFETRALPRPYIGATSSPPSNSLNQDSGRMELRTYLTLCPSR